MKILQTARGLLGNLSEDHPAIDKAIRALEGEEESQGAPPIAYEEGDWSISLLSMKQVEWELNQLELHECDLSFGLARARGSFWLSALNGAIKVECFWEAVGRLRESAVGALDWDAPAISPGRQEGQEGMVVSNTVAVVDGFGDDLRQSEEQAFLKACALHADWQGDVRDSLPKTTKDMMSNVGELPFRVNVEMTEQEAEALEWRIISADCLGCSAEYGQTPYGKAQAGGVITIEAMAPAGEIIRIDAYWSARGQLETAESGFYSWRISNSSLVPMLRDSTKVVIACPTGSSDAHCGKKGSSSLFIGALAEKALEAGAWQSRAENVLPHTKTSVDDYGHPFKSRKEARLA